MLKENEVILTGSDSEISIEITIPKQVDGGKLLKLQKQDQLYFLVVSSLILLKTSWKRS